MLLFLRTVPCIMRKSSIYKEKPYVSYIQNGKVGLFCLSNGNSNAALPNSAWNAKDIPGFSMENQDFLGNGL